MTNPELSQQANHQETVGQILRLQGKYVDLIANARDYEIRQFNNETSEVEAALGGISVPGIIHSMQFVYRGNLVDPLPVGCGMLSVDVLQSYTVSHHNYPMVDPNRIKRHQRMRAYQLLGVAMYPMANHQNKLLFTHSVDSSGSRTAIGADPSNPPELLTSIRVIDTL
jgi:hypothetical protein